MNSSLESLLREQLKDLEEEVLELCHVCRRATEGKDFLNFSRIINTVGNVVRKTAPIIQTATRLAQKM